ncbi:preprotein translocase subunit SecG [Candidatus Berkelbacteria bacterium RIFCSPLOWO2_01_FULL_50_28]|uniref:Protein-export membrane protein SecG n=1 Tax=Candidatus Berkelbacteria bacterium RIFCSPLOWO2_01_FULL_50_28 TaxID=1797471 RepID=A0A1F5EA99_9BACT|nr:MAG: preprotein translocase subunit SecG [Candidatus Berkelbacteria bacterium RIFCSPHIGHO2_12_FULL_50_11]OGD64283.1 MAG: preprotein translocase subunit SecG [Candidatus Berkelbacteria bacterium RIFCSPLOWO2_01_FULL_50_28]
MANFLQVTLIVSGILLIISILLQHRGSGLGGAFGGESTSYRSRRGIESLLYRLTILSAAVFLVAAIARLFV